ncbi:MAG: hypothetical protein ACYC4M_10175 [Thermoleophilia bacterium]
MAHMTLYLVIAAAAVINLPCGYLRAGYPRLSWPWLVAIHAPVPLVIVLRLLSDNGWGIVPLLIASAVLGQLAGGLLRGSQRSPAVAEETNE